MGAKLHDILKVSKTAGVTAFCEALAPFGHIDNGGVEEFVEGRSGHGLKTTAGNQTPTTNRNHAANMKNLAPA